MPRAIAYSLVLLVLPLVALAADQAISLPGDPPCGHSRPGPGLAPPRTHALTCHSTDYIVMQPRGDAKQWQGVVTKMIKVYGAPISDQDAQAIAEYLATAYGPAK